MTVERDREAAEVGTAEERGQDAGESRRAGGVERVADGPAGRRTSLMQRVGTNKQEKGRHTECLRTLRQEGSSAQGGPTRKQGAAQRHGEQAPHKEVEGAPSRGLSQCGEHGYSRRNPCTGKTVPGTHTAPRKAWGPLSGE